MKSIFAIFTFIFMFAMIEAKAADVNFANHLQVIDIHPVASVNASGDTSAVDLAGYAGNCAAVIDTVKSSGDGTTAMAIKLTHSSTSGGSYTDVTGGAFTALGAGASVQKIVINKNSLKRYVKINKVISGASSPAYLISGKLYCQKKYPQ